MIVSRPMHHNNNNIDTELNFVDTYDLRNCS